jgi:hypothetical protein
MSNLPREGGYAGSAGPEDLIAINENGFPAERVRAVVAGHHAEYLTFLRMD